MKQLDWEPSCVMSRSLRNLSVQLSFLKMMRYEILSELILLYLVISSLRFYFLLNKLEEYEAPLCTVWFPSIVSISPWFPSRSRRQHGSTECMDLVHSNSLYYLADLLVSCHTNTSFIISSILLTGEPISLEEGLNKKERKKEIAQIKLVNSACFSLKIDQGIPLMDWVRKGN